MTTAQNETPFVIDLPSGATLHPLVLPARADAGRDGALLAYADVRNRCLEEASGRDDDAFSAEELLPLLTSDSHTTRRQWRILHGERTVGVVVFTVLHDDGGATAVSVISVLKQAQGRGIGTAVAAHLEHLARTEGVRTLQVWTEHVPTEDPVLVPPTGFGSIPRDHTSRFLLAQGWTLEQVDRVSEYRWSTGDDQMPALRAQYETAQAAATGYRVVQWLLPTPDERLAGYAWMKSRMSTDAPDADMGSPEETWDADRVREQDERWLDMGYTVQVTAAEHIATGELCAYNELSLKGADDSVTEQNDTLVLAEHRGHRLGLLVKTAGLLSWHEGHPRSTRVITYNAEENRPMLSINEQIGFVPIGYGGAWKKALA
ncbi:Acetyltransferase (GNAT) family protein [Microbacterium azadirachtae]|uniref:Acetyltransferase (GNAT) family protein n=1 Tax=Microbacterium azadirachtae TaxID=582680 RepID=A0A0F0K8R7_9MICO|nr:GNAT family N-acetyltransferase [Microbacterium azadirachtae]KJL17303.1 Acetyltransferase (GNAT) family protein [Microbacterium azadirachtae]